MTTPDAAARAELLQNVAMKLESGTQHCAEKLQEASDLIDNLFKSASSSFKEPSAVVTKKMGYRSQMQNLLDNKTAEEGTEYLISTAVDLLHEVEVLKVSLEEVKVENTALKQEITSAKEKDIERVDALVSALQNATKADDCTLSTERAETLSAEQASTLTITTLARKIEDLNVKNTQLAMENQELVDIIEDLGCEGEAKDVKIKALETQFKSINKTRQKVVNQSLQQMGIKGATKDDNKENQGQKTAPSSRISYLQMSSRVVNQSLQQMGQQMGIKGTPKNDDTEKDRTGPKHTPPPGRPSYLRMKSRGFSASAAPAQQKAFVGGEQNIHEVGGEEQQ